MTENSRKAHITAALAALNERPNEARETYRAPIRGSKLLDVIDIPLDVPVLNADSFRIAATLQEHPQRQLVVDDPDSPEAQVIVAQLVRKAHRKADDLLENLLDEGQVQPGVITRSGKLINANTRCVLLRELAATGRGTVRTLRVAVLPPDVTANELLELEMVLQQQVDLKDEYRLVNKLLMIEKLHDHGFTDDQIARILRESNKARGGKARITDQREVLRLMRRAAKLPSEPISINHFDQEVDQLQNWLELLRQVRKLEDAGRPREADQHIRRWMTPYLVGVSSVHNLRHAVDDWIESEGVVEAVQDHDDLRSVLAAVPSQVGPVDAEDLDEELGLGLLGSDEPESRQDENAAQAVLDLTVAALKAGHGDVKLPNGRVVAGTDIKETLRTATKDALERKKRRFEAGSRLQRPATELERARVALVNALEALAEVGSDAEFTGQRPVASERAAEVLRLAMDAAKVLGIAIHASHEGSVSDD